MAGRESRGEESSAQQSPDWDVDLLIVIMKIPKQAIKGINETKRNVMEWMNEWRYEWRNEWTNEWHGECDRVTDFRHCKWGESTGQTNRQTDKQSEKQPHRQSCRQWNRQSGRQGGTLVLSQRHVRPLQIFSPPFWWLLLENGLFVLQLNLRSHEAQIA